MESVCRKKNFQQLKIVGCFLAKKSGIYSVRTNQKQPLGAVRKSKNCKQDKKTAPSCKFSYFTKQVKENATGRSFDFFKQSGNPIFALLPTTQTLTTRRKNFMKNILDFY